MLPGYIFTTPNPRFHYPAIAALISAEETSPTSPESFAHWTSAESPASFRLEAALDPTGELVGFICLYPHAGELDQRFNAYLIVKPERRGQGVGRMLFSRLLERMAQVSARQVYFSIDAADDHSLGFAIRRGLLEDHRSIEMTLEQSNLNQPALEGLLAHLAAQGFVFTSMAALGDTPDARQRLYRLNASTAATTPGSDGVESWTSFDDFNHSVCESEWYRPAGQIVAIHQPSLDWAGMSAITRFTGADHAYNLFTGVLPQYRGRGLAQAVKGLALRYAFTTLSVTQVRTNHVSANAPMIAIDRKLGYRQTAETIWFLMDRS